jgi:tetratricopeptide (TPR) repeat protein
MAQYAAADGVIARHETLLVVVAECYKQRKNNHYLQFGQRFAEAYPQLYRESLAALQKADPKAELKGVGFMQLSTLCTDSGHYELAIDLCQQALELGLDDGTVTGFDGRIKRIEKTRLKAGG